MPNIARPFVTDDDPDREIRCQDALQAAFRELLIAATLAGWSEREATRAIGELADKHLLSLESNDNTDALIALLLRMT